VVAGKGHEDYQIVGTERRHFDDRETVRELLQGSGVQGFKGPGSEPEPEPQNPGTLGPSSG
jgi:hypothetical protein